MRNSALQPSGMINMANNVFKNLSFFPEKKIQFYNIVSVVLIPCIQDMDTEMREQLWWNKEDYMSFYIDSKAEIDFFLRVNSDLKYKDAVRLLYQHSLICYEPYYEAEQDHCIK